MVLQNIYKGYEMSKQSSVLPMLIIGGLFFIFGFVTWLNGSLIPFLKVLLDLSSFEALFVSFAFYIAYTVMALPMATLLEKTGYKNGMAIGLGVMGVGSLLFIPAAFSASFFLFLVALFTLGTGLTILQTASNPYIVLMGDIKSAAMRISIMGLINKSAGVLAPIVFTLLIFSDMGSAASLSEQETANLASRLVIPYVAMAVLLFLLIALVKFSGLPELEFETNDSEDKQSIFSFPRVVLGAVALFFYVGIEVIAGDTIGLYAQDIGLVNATALTSYTMVFMVIAYGVGVVSIPKLLSQEKALIGSAILGMLFIVGIVFSSTTQTTISAVLWGWSGIGLLPNSITFVALLGLSNALVWPTIWPLALEGMGKHTAKASALLIMAISGGALLPLLFGKIAQVSGNMQASYALGILFYGVILLYGMKWHKKGQWV